MSPTRLAIDVGTSSARAIAVDDQHQVVCAASEPLLIQRHGDDRVEQDANQILAATSKVIGDVLRVCRQQNRSVIEAGMATQRSSVLLWDRATGSPRTRLLSWQDRRTSAWLQQQAWDKDQMMRTTGLPVSAHYGASKMRWLLRESEAIPRQVAAGPLAAFLIQQLTRESTFAIDPTNAARMQLVDLRSPLRWDRELLAKFELCDDVLPPIRPSHGPFGMLSVDGDTSIPLRLVCGDQFAVLHAEDDCTSAPVLLNLGTGGFVVVATETIPSSETKLLRSPGVAHEYVLEGTINGAGAAIDWAARRFGLEPRSLPWEAWETGPPTHLKFVNFVGGRGSPSWQSSGRSFWVDQHDVEQEPVDVRACMLAVVDSIAELVAENLAEMRHLGIPCHDIRMTGGLSKLNCLHRRITERCECHVHRATRTEATAHGVINLLKRHPLSR